MIHKAEEDAKAMKKMKRGHKTSGKHITRN